MLAVLFLVSAETGVVRKGGIKECLFVAWTISSGKPRIGGVACSRLNQVKLHSQGRVRVQAKTRHSRRSDCEGRSEVVK